jgi:predicted transcriptional regulator
MMVETIGHQLFLPNVENDRLEELAARKIASTSAILAGAVAAWLDRRTFDDERRDL